MAAKNNNLYIVDIAKFLCAILIVLLHTAPFSSISSVLDMGFRNTVTTIAVPFFFAISGYFFSKKLLCVNENERKSVFLKTEKRLVFLYCFYSLVYLPFTIKSWIIGGFSLEKLLSYIYNFFFVGSFSTIWYLLASVVAVFLCYISLTKLDIKKGFILATVFYIFGCLISSYYGAIEKFSFTQTIADTYYNIFSTVKNGVTFGWIYMMIGSILAKKDIENSLTFENKTPYILLIGSFGLLTIEAVIQYIFNFSTKGVDLKIALIPFSYFFLRIIIGGAEVRLQNTNFIVKNASLWIHLRKLSILIFLLQRIPLTLLANVKMNSVVYTLVILVSTIALSEIVILLSSKFNFFKKIY